MASLGTGPALQFSCLLNCTSPNAGRLLKAIERGFSASVQYETLVLERYQRFSYRNDTFPGQSKPSQIEGLKQRPGYAWGCESDLLWLRNFAGLSTGDNYKCQNPSGGVTDARHHFGDWVHLFLPCGDQQHFVPRGIAKDIVNVGGAIKLIEAGPAHIGSPGKAYAEKQAEFRELFRGMLPEVLNHKR